MAKIRAHILLEPEQHRLLVKIAERESRSVSDLRREFVQEGIEQRQHLFHMQKEKHLHALERARQVRQAFLAPHGGEPPDLDMPAPMNGLRNDRDDQILARND